MRLISVLIGFLISVCTSAQTIYFNDIQSQDWNESTVTNVEIYENHYYIFGNYLGGASNQGTFIQKIGFDGAFVSNVLVLDSIIVPNFAESFNIYQGNILVAGSKTAMQANMVGEIDWNIFKFYPEIYFNDLSLSFQLSSSSYIFIGQKAYDVDDDVWPEYNNLHIFKTDAQGVELWDTELEISEDLVFRANVMHELTNGEFIILGGTTNSLDGWFPFIIKVDSLGNLINFEQFGQEEENNFLPWSVLDEENDRLVMVHANVTGVDDFSGFDISSMVVSTYDLSTNEIEQVYESDSTGIFLHTHDFVKTPDGGYAILAYKGGVDLLPSFIHKLDSEFQFEWQKEYKYADGYTQNYLYDFEITPDGGFICAGETYGQNSNTHPRSSWLLKLDACGDMEWQGCDTTTTRVNELECLGPACRQGRFEVYPNPASNRITVSLNSSLPLNNTQAVFRNTLGQEVFATQITASEQEVDVSLLPSGVYMLSLVSDGRVVYSERVVRE